MEPSHLEDSGDEYVPGTSEESSSDYSDVIPVTFPDSSSHNISASKASTKQPSSALGVPAFYRKKVSPKTSSAPTGLSQIVSSSAPASVVVPEVGTHDVSLSQPCVPGTSKASDESDDNIYVMVTDNQGGDRKWDKIYYCLFCQKPQKKLPRHITSQHADEDKVQEYLSEKDKQKKTSKMIFIRNLGNHKHNCDVIRNGRGTLIVTHRPRHKVKVDEYGPCETCFAYILRNDLWRHRCPLEEEKSEEQVTKKRKAVSCKLLLPPPKGMSQNLHEVTHAMRADDITRIAKSDNLIIVFGEKLCQKLGHNKFQYNYIRCKLREMGRFLLQLREDSKNPNGKLEDYICPDQFRLLVSSARKVSGFDEEGHTYSTPSLALKLGHSIRKCARILQGRSIELDQEEKKKKCKSFLQLMDINWLEEMSSNALRTLYDAKRNKVKLLPLADDVRLLSAYLKQKGKTAYECLQKNQNEGTELTSQWGMLRDIVLTRLILFNRRRQGEVSQLSIEDFQKIHTAGKEGFVMEGLTKLEQKLCQHFYRLEVRGKRGNTVPILINSETKKWLDMLMVTRTHVVSAPDNKYVFARCHYGSLEYARGSDCLREISKECGAKEPELLRSTKLRKQIATMSQVLNLKDNELDVLARFLGHDIRVHREYYRLPDQTLQVAKVTKLLLAMEKGGEGMQLGQRLDDINIHEDEGILF